MSSMHVYTYLLLGRRMLLPWSSVVNAVWVEILGGEQDELILFVTNNNDKRIQTLNIIGPPFHSSLPKKREESRQ